MSKPPPTTQIPIATRGARKSEVRTQFAALCYRLIKGKPEILLITSRGTKRWIVPKGWPMDGLTPAQAALQEAWEEAGVVGRAIERCVGVYSYEKFLDSNISLPCVAMVYPVRVEKMAKDFPEAGERKRHWFTPKKAASKVDEPDLGALIRSFDPAAL